MKADTLLYILTILLLLITIFLIASTPLKIFSSLLVAIVVGFYFRKKHLKSDVSSQVKSLEDQIHYLENHDQLTGLANRNGIRRRLVQLYRKRQQKIEFAVIYVEIDRFKHINDTFGHLKGDQLLKVIAQRLVGLSPVGSLVGRQGGDEFMIITDHMDIHAVSGYLEEIHKSMQRPFQLGGMEIYALPSIGMAMFPHHADQLSTLVARADIAMYAAKEQGGNRIVIYHDDMNTVTKENIKLEGKLHKAIVNGDIEVFYQPQVDARTDQIIGAEALIRWKDEERGYIPPSEFIPIAEENGLIEQLSLLVLEDACVNLARWNSLLEKPIRVSVNLSSKHFGCPENLVTQIVDMLTKHQVNPEWLELEITESILMTNMEAAREVLMQLREQGIQISIDDFGTGYSSLSYLNELPIDKLKIDQSFIRGIDPELNNKVIALAIINLAKSLNLGVIAEGVDVDYQKDLLLKNHCVEMQGYLFSRPVPVKDFENLLFSSEGDF